MSELAATHTMRRHIGSCPACRSLIWVEAVIETRVAEPSWVLVEAKPAPDATVRVVAATVAHDCDSRKEIPDE